MLAGKLFLLCRLSGLWGFNPIYREIHYEQVVGEFRFRPIK